MFSDVLMKTKGIFTCIVSKQFWISRLFWPVKLMYNPYTAGPPAGPPATGRKKRKKRYAVTTDEDKVEKLTTIETPQV